MDNDKQSNASLMPIGLLAVAAVIFQKQNAIKLWLFENGMWLILAAIVLVGLIVWRFISNVKKRDDEVFRRARAVREARPTRHARDYYERDR